MNDKTDINIWRLCLGSQLSRQFDDGSNRFHHLNSGDFISLGDHKKAVEELLKKQNEFESWFLSLNEDFGSEELTKGSNGDYFYTTTYHLHKLYTEVQDLLRKQREGCALVYISLINSGVSYTENAIINAPSPLGE